MVNLIVIVAAVLVAALQFKQYRQFTQRLSEFGKGGEPLQSTELSKARRGALFLPALAGVLMAAYVVLRPGAVSEPKSWLLLDLVLEAVFLPAGITADMSQRLYYNRKGFLLRDRFVTFAEVDAFEGNGRMGNALRLRDGTRCPMSRLQWELLAQVRAREGKP